MKPIKLDEAVERLLVDGPTNVDSLEAFVADAPRLEAQIAQWRAKVRTESTDDLQQRNKKRYHEGSCNQLNVCGT